ncbi:oligosaccharide flippase family protein [Dyella marensis]|uniref:Membrane protein involved in the export of O-antigen and teichoic acid n=1 Tax=Dyella marensis TaxID=500610 RepID=A0A1I2IJH4_9GAMM|nr:MULTISPECIES: oligosaccharide flippase family protein [Dyella]SFF42522.1 Membrane protein involved in the export of O-antigen and teichoic acid [Dyella marensis]
MSLRRNVIANYLGAGWAALMNIAFVPLYIRYMGAEAYGLVGVFLVLQGMLSLLDLGMAPSIGREMARVNLDHDAADARTLLRTIEWVVLALAFAVLLFVALLAPWLAASWLHLERIPEPVAVHSILLMGGIVGLRLVENVYRSALIGLQQQVALNVVLAFAATLRGAGSWWVLANVSAGASAFFTWQLLVACVSVALFAWAVYRRLPSTGVRSGFSLEKLHAVKQFAGGVMLITGMALLLSNLDKVLLSRLLPLDVFGRYTFAATIAQAPLGLVVPIVQAFYPRFTKYWTDGKSETLVDAYHFSAQLVSVALGSAAMFVVLYGRQALRLWTGDMALADSVYVITAVLTLGTMLNGMMTVPYYLQLSAGWTSLMARANVVAVVLMIPVLLVVVPRYGATGAAWAWLALNGAYVLLVVPLMHRKLLGGERTRWYVFDVAMPLAASLAVGGLLRQFDISAYAATLQWVGLLIIGGLMLAASALAAPLVRVRIEALLRPRA